jgi:very-short-patch-repair endonuclease
MPNIRDHDARLIRFARQMRKTPSDAERRLWHIVRRNKLGGFYFRRQVPIEGYIADFYCDAAKLVVEVDGSQHYDDPEQIAHDQQRTIVFGRLGLKVVRFSSRDVLKQSDAVAKTILSQLLALSWPPP